jgi:hypothetical protein
MVQVYPPSDGGVLMHEYMLAGWGMPIGMLLLRGGSSANECR